MMQNRILVLDDRKDIRDKLAYHLKKNSYIVLKAGTIAEAKNIVLTEKINTAIVDLKIDYESEFGGIIVANYIKKIQPHAKVIILSAYKLNENISSQLDFEIDGFVDKGGIENYITAIINRLNEFKKHVEPKLCFVIMPFSTTRTCNENEWTEIYENLIKPAVEDSGQNYICRRSGAMIGNIIEGILKDLNRADIVIADLTDRNPNVYYELGVRQAIRDATILISQNMDDVPFDLKTQATHIYNWKLTDSRKAFKEKIVQLIRLVETNPEEVYSPVKKYLTH